MDTGYTNKKYFQSLGNGDYYRNSGTLRHMGNDYSTYHHNNTMGRRSALLPYTGTTATASHMSKYSYPTDVSLSSTSHYGYTSWGLWRDSRNISPSIYSHKKRRNIKSFSIILMSAAFIVVLAVLAVAGLAFYFSTFKSDQSDSILVFDSAMSVTKGDIFTAGLKNSQSSVFQQKANFYERVIRNALEHSGLTVSKVEISSFGDGPFINITFRVFLDMRKIQVTINNVEEHMKNSFLNEISLPKPEYKDIFINPDSISIKRLLDHDVLKSASIIQSSKSEPKSNAKIIDQDKITKKEKPKATIKTTKTTTKSTPRPSFNEADIDIDSLPVIQGSFEVTKTEADITRNTKETPKTTSTLKPFMISPASIRITDNRNHTFQRPEVVTAKIEKTDKHGVATTTTTTTTTSTTTTPRTTTTTTRPTTTTTAKPDISAEKQVKTTVVENTTQKIPRPDPLGLLGHNKDLPALDVNLFTSAPVLDDEPWHPIHPNTPKLDDEIEVVTPSVMSPTQTSTEVPAPITKKPLPSLKDELLLYRNKIDTQSYIDSQGNLYFYNSFKNPATAVEIENLGAMDVRPYPLPVNKITNEIETTTQPSPVSSSTAAIINITVDEDKFEHLGGGVIAKKEEEEKSTEANYMENKLESRAGDTDIKAVSAEKLAEGVKTLLHLPSTTTTTSSTTIKPTTEPIQLFPIGAKWQFVNGTRVTPFENIGLRKVYNQTLQALVVENSQPQISDVEDFRIEKPKIENLQNISSIFDTIASKLGIKPDLSSKIPPFQERLTTTTSTTTSTTTTTTTPKPTPKATPSRTTTRKITTTTTVRPTKRITKATRSTTRRSTTVTTTTPSTTTTRMVPVQLYRAGEASHVSLEQSSESLLGQAEVEIVDPNAYDDMLRQSQQPGASTAAVSRGTTSEPLVTLLPVKSNSGIRNFNREKLKHTAGIVQSAQNKDDEDADDDDDMVSKKSFNSRGPIFADNMESIVKTSMIVEV